MQVTRILGLWIIGLISVCNSITVNPNKHGHYKDKIKDNQDIPHVFTVVKVKFPVSGEHIKSSSNMMVPKFRKKPKYTMVDYVRGDALKPMSRDNIMSIRNPAFHGRMAPGQFKNGRKPTKFKPSEPFQVDYQKIKYEQQQLVNQKTAPVQFPKYQENEGSFYPLLKPSPINVVPIDPPSHDAIRQYTRYIKYRQKQLLNDLDNPNRRELQHLEKVNPYDGEILYFRQREKELADEARGNFQNKLSPNDFGKNDRDLVAEVEDDKAKLKKKMTKKYQNTEKNKKRMPKDESDESREDKSESASVSEEKQANKEETTEESVEESTEKAGENSNNEHSASVEDAGEDESKVFENFVPFRMYAQVRHIESESHEEPPKNDPRLKKEVTHLKRHLYFSEDGFKHKLDEQGAYQNKGEFQEKYRRRRKREALSEEEIHNRTIELLPMALALVKKSELPNLTGEKLLSYLDELIKNSSIYIPEDTYESDSYAVRSKNSPITIIPKPFSKINSKKYPYYGLPSDVLSEMSALRYAESIKHFPQSKRSIYEQKKTKLCEPIDFEYETAKTPKDKFDSKLPDLSEKVDCLKTKHFGKDPLDNPLFKEEYVAAAIPIPWKIYSNNNLLEHQKNPLITVYDDVISNIRAGILEETKIRKKATEQDGKRAASSEHVPTVTGNTSIASFGLTDNNELKKYHQNMQVQGTKVPIFDITTYYPRLSIKPSKDILETKEESKIPTRGEVKDLNVYDHNKKGWIAIPAPANGEYVMEIIEAPPIKRHYKNKFLQQQQPPPPPPPTHPSPIKTNYQQQHQKQQQPKQKRFPRPVHSPSKNPKRYSNQKRQLYHYKLL